MAGVLLMSCEGRERANEMYWLLEKAGIGYYTEEYERNEYVSGVRREREISIFVSEEDYDKAYGLLITRQVTEVVNGGGEQRRRNAKDVYLLLIWVTSVIFLLLITAGVHIKYYWWLLVLLAFFVAGFCVSKEKGEGRKGK